MNKNIIYGFGIVLLTIGLNSCGKTTKRRVTGDWKIVSLEEEGTSVYGQGTQKTIWKTSMTKTTVSNYNMLTSMDVDGPFTDTTASEGVVKENKLSIQKDGTWQWNQELYYTEDDGSGKTKTTTHKTDLSGTWSFIGKTNGDDFKKNERMVLNILLNKRSRLTKSPAMVLNDFSEETTYLTGEHTMTFTVKESKKKELQLELESATNYSYTGSGGVNSTNKTLKITLKEQ